MFLVFLLTFTGLVLSSAPHTAAAAARWPELSLPDVKVTESSESFVRAVRAASARRPISRLIHSHLVLYTEGQMCLWGTAALQLCIRTWNLHDVQWMLFTSVIHFVLCDRDFILMHESNVLCRWFHTSGVILMFFMFLQHFAASVVYFSTSVFSVFILFFFWTSSFSLSLLSEVRDWPPQLAPAQLPREETSSPRNPPRPELLPHTHQWQHHLPPAGLRKKAHTHTHTHTHTPAAFTCPN